MIKQKWTVLINGDETSVEYSCSLLTGKTVLTVGSDSFKVNGKPFGIGISRREMIMIAGEQAVLDVQKNGRANLICREGEVKEITT